MRLGKGACLVFALALAGCDRLTLSAPPAPGPAPAAAEARPIQDLEAYAGRSYAELLASQPDRFDSEALGLGAADQERLQRLIAGASGTILDGGGAQALVFRGCAASGCDDGVAIVAVDGGTGAMFIGVRDGHGKDLLVPNDRLEALLRLNSDTRDWPDAGAGEVLGEARGEAAPGPERP